MDHAPHNLLHTPYSCLLTAGGGKNATIVTITMIK
jgi:hypothetical protein